MREFPVLDVVTGETGILLFDEEWRFEAEDTVPEFALFPAYFNAHTHIGDSAVEAPRTELEQLVGPGGYKFRVLEETDRDVLVDWMKRSVRTITRTSSTSLEFREGGIDGYRLYMEADPERVLIALSRPRDEEEAEKLVEMSMGFNFSSVRDHDFDLIEYCRDLAKRYGKIFAIHAGERDSSDVELALTLEPDFVVHMNMAERWQIDEAMENGFVVTCFRSNAFFGLMNTENYRYMAGSDSWLLGTDNVMIATPSMLDEVRFASYFIDPETVFSASTRNPFFESYAIADIDKINPKNPITSVVRRLESCDIVKIIRSRVRFE